MAIVPGPLLSDRHMVRMDHARSYHLGGASCGDPGPRTPAATLQGASPVPSRASAGQVPGCGVAAAGPEHAGPPRRPQDVGANNRRHGGAIRSSPTGWHCSSAHTEPVPGPAVTCGRARCPYPKVAERLESTEADLTAHFAFPAAHHHRVRSIDPRAVWAWKSSGPPDVVGIVPTRTICSYARASGLLQG